MKSNNFSSSVVAIMMVISCLCIGLSGTPALGVNVTFSDPFVVNETQTYYPAGMFETDYSVSDLVVGEGPEFDLVLMKISSEENWSMALVDHGGRLVDTLPRYLLPLAVTLSDTFAFTIAGVSWIDPYYHVFESRHDTLFYTRIAADLTVIDSLPVPYLKGDFGSLLVDGARLWVMSKRVMHVPIHLRKYEFPDPTPMNVGLEIPESYNSVYRGMALAFDSLTSANNLYLYAVDIDSSTIAVFRVTPAGEVDTLAKAPCPNIVGTLPARVGFFPLESDSVLLCWVYKHYFNEPYDFRYFKLAGSGPISGITPTIINLPDIPINSGLPSGEYHYDTNSVHLVSNHFESNLYSRLVELEFDLEANSHELKELLAEGNPYYYSSKMAYKQHDTTAFFYYVNGPHANLITYSSDAETPDVKVTPVLYRTRAYTQPTFLTDDQGILLYLQTSNTNGPALEGYRFDYDLVPSADTPFPVLSDDPMPTSPALYQIDGRRALNWCNYQEEGHNDNFNFYAKLLFFEGDQPGSLDWGDKLRLTGCDNCYPVEMVQLDSLLFVNQLNMRSSSIWTLGCSTARYMIRLKLNPTIEYSRGHWAEGKDALITNGDTAVVVYSEGDCIDESSGTCWAWRYNYAAYGMTGDTIAQYYYIEDLDFAGAAPYLDVHSGVVDGGYILSFKNDFILKSVDFSTMKFEPVVDLEESSGHDFGYSLFHPYIIHPVETNDAIAVFFINEDTYIKGQIQSDYGDCHLMVFDKQWNFKYYSKLPLAGVVKDMGDIRYSPEADKIFYAYSTYLTGQYASSRVVVQSISIDDVTGADAGRPTVPTTFYVRQNSPNPFNASTRIDFDLPAKSQMSITVFNLLGQKVKTVLSGSLESGRHSVYWDGTDHDGTTVASGVYIYQVRTEHDSATRKMILLK